MRAIPRVAVAVAVAALVTNGPILGAEKIRLLGGSFKPKPTLRVFQPWKGAPGPELSGTRYVLVRLDGHLDESTEGQLAGRGIHLLRHYQRAWFLAKATGVEKEGLQGFLDGLGVKIAPIEPSKKLRLWPAHGKDGRRYIVRFHERLEKSEVDELLGSIRPGLEAEESKRCDCWSVTLTRSEAKKLAAKDVVNSIDPDDPRIIPLIDCGRTALGVDTVQAFTGSSTSYTFAGLSGAGTVGAILDEEGASDSRDFFMGVNPDGTTKATRLTNLATDEKQHATWMAGIIGANGAWDTPGDWTYLGIAPQAALVTINASNNNKAAFVSALADKLADVTNNSYAVPETDVGPFATFYDRLIRGDESFTAGGGSLPLVARPSAFSAGNNGQEQKANTPAWVGYYSILNPTKNGIVVGGCVVTIDGSGRTCNARAGCSSIGPAFDGRLKPDIVAPADKQDAWKTEMAFMLPTTTKSSTLYLSLAMCGTSFAAAYVSGIVLLMTEECEKVQPAQRPYPSTFKAALINSAIDLVEPSEGPYSSSIKKKITVESFPGPDYATGYGEVSATGAVATIRDGRFREGTLVDHDASLSFEVEVPAGAAELKITLAWDDDSPDVNRALDEQQLENDLDLQVTPPSSSTPESPWTLAPCSGVAPGTHSKTDVPTCAVAATPNLADHTNNVEQYVKADPATGTWLVTVNSHDLPFNNPQTFSLASSSPFKPELDAQILEANVGPNSVIPDALAAVSTVDIVNLAAGHSVVVPLGPFCRKAKCAPCGRYGRCPDIDIEFDDLPEDAVLKIVDGKGKKLGDVERVDRGNARLKWKRTKRDGAFLVVRTDGPAPPPDRPPRMRMKANERVSEP